MKRALKIVKAELYHITKEGVRVPGLHAGLSGHISSDLSGDIDDCCLTQADRKAGIKISDLIQIEEAAKEKA